MSELREECYKCLNNQSCPGAANYGSILCMTRRKYKMPGNKEDSIYAHKFALMQQQIDEKDKRIKELEVKLEFKSYGDLDNIQFEEYLNQFIPKQKVKDKIEEVHNMKFEDERLNSATIDFAVHKFEELLEDK